MINIREIVYKAPIFPPTRKLMLINFSSKISNEKKINEDFIEGESEDIDDNK